MPYLSLYAKHIPRIPSPLLGIAKTAKFLSPDSDVSKDAETSPSKTPSSKNNPLDSVATTHLPADVKQAPVSDQTGKESIPVLSKSKYFSSRRSFVLRRRKLMTEKAPSQKFESTILKEKTNQNEAILSTTHRGVPRIFVVEVPPEEKLIKKSWLLNPNKPPKKSNEPYIERVPIDIKKDDMLDNLYRSRSLDFSDTLRESYLSRWSRENTPIDSQDQYIRTVRRSFTPVREVGDYRYVEDDRKPITRRRIFSPLDVVTVPYHTNYRYYQEQQPFRKYDIFQVRTWAYPIYK